LFKTIEYFRENKKNISIILGGAGLYGFNLEEMIKYYPEIKYIVVGMGEKIFAKIVKNSLDPGIYYEKSFDIEKYRMIDMFINTLDDMNISFDRSHCLWGKCKFCHHSNSVTPNSFDEVLEEVLYYYDKGIKKFNVIDNFLIFNKFYKLLDELLLRNINDVSFYLMGVHVQSDWNRIHEYVPKFQKLITNIGVGFEFLDDEILKLYNKRSTVKRIFEFSEYFYNNGVRFTPFMLASLPSVSDKNIMLNNENFEKIYNQVYHVNLSHFLLSPSIQIFNEKEKHGIKLNKNYTMKDFSLKLEKISTDYFDFDTFNKDKNTFFSRKEELNRYSHLLKNNKVSLARTSFLNGESS